MKLRTRVAHITIGFIGTPLVLLLLSPRDYLLSLTAWGWLYLLLGVALPGAVTGLFAVSVKSPLLLTVIGAVLAGSLYLVPVAAYAFIVTGDKVQLATTPDNLVGDAIGALAIVIIGSFPGTYFAFGRFLVKILSTRLPTHL